MMIGATPIDYQWVVINTAGHTQRAFTTAMMNAAFAIGNIIGPETFKAKDAHYYEPAKISLVPFWSFSELLALILRAYYEWCNAQRDKVAKVSDDDISETKAYAGLTDKENKEFQYTY
jgi:hypothetical protein